MSCGSNSSWYWMSNKKKAAAGVKWASIGTITLAVTSILKLSVLARFLDKADFGLMALITFFVGLMELFNDMGLTSAILHRQGISKNEYASLYWLNFGVSLAMYLVLLALTPLVAGFYGQSELQILIPLLGLNLIISALGRQFKLIEQKKMAFKRISLIDISTAMLSLGVAVLLAVNGYGVYALVFSLIFQYLSSNLLFLLSGLRAQGLLLHFRYADTKPFLKIGVFQVGGEVINYFNKDLDVLLIGKLFGAELLGGYSLAKQLIRRPLQIVNPIANKVGSSLFPKYQHESERLQNYFLSFLKAFGPLNAWVYGSMAIFAPYLVELFYGPGFSSIVLYVQLFAVLIYLRALAGTINILVITKGRTDYNFYWNILTSILMPVSIFIGARYAMEGIIISMTLVQLGLLIPSWNVFFRRLIGMGFMDFLRPHILPLLVAALVFALGQVLFAGHFVGTLATLLLLGLSLAAYTYFTLEEFRVYVKKIYSRYARI